MKAGCSAFGYKKIERQQLLGTIWCQSFQVIAKAIINRVLVFLERIGRQKYGIAALKDTKKSEFTITQLFALSCGYCLLLCLHIHVHMPMLQMIASCFFLFCKFSGYVLFFFCTKQPQLHLTWLQSTRVHRFSIDCIHLQKIPKGQ